MHKELCTRICTFWFLAGACLLVVQPTSAQPENEVPSAVANAQETIRGYGLSVFRGQAPERFEVEILGEIGGVAVGDDYILARLTGAGLEESGVIAGMSGSPVYVDGELVGAVAFAWPFSKEAIGGITPIETMRRQLLAPAPHVLRRPAVAWERLFDLRRPEERLRAWTRRLVPVSQSEGQVSLQLAASGLSRAAQEWLSSVVGGLAPAGRATVTGPLSPGGAIAGVLVDGDWKLAVTGTVTDVEGDRVLAFGHPFLANGTTNLPMAPAEVVTVVSNQLNSFKVSNFGEPVGRFDFDRAAGVAGRLGETAGMVPMRIEMSPAGHAYSMRLAQVPELLPVLAGLSLFQTTATAGHVAGTYGLELEVTFDLGKHGDLTLKAVHDGSGAAVAAALQLIQYVDFLHNNPWQEVEVEELRLKAGQHSQPISLQVLGASVERTRVEAGDTLRGSVRVKGYRDAIEERPFEFVLPPDVAPGVYHLLVGDARSVDLARWATTGEQPQTFDQALRMLRRLRNANALAIVGLRQSGGVVVDGVALPGLPASVARVVASGAGARPIPWHVEALFEQPSQRPLNGVSRLQLQITKDDTVDGEDGEDNS